MDSFFELERYNAPLPGLVFREEQFRNYVIKWTRYDGHDSMWVFCDGNLKGSVQWMDMLSLDTNNQILMRYPNAFEGLLYAQWEPSPDATEADLSIALSRLQRMYVEVAPEDKHAGLLIHGYAALGIDDTLSACELSIGNVPVVAFQTNEDDTRLIDVRRSTQLAYWSEFETMLEPDTQQAMLDVGDYVLDFLTSLLPETSAVIH